LQETLRWFLSWSIRWKLQFGFFAVTMITTIFNRWLASAELQKMVDIAEQHQIGGEAIAAMVASRDAYIFNSFWESGIEFAIQFMVIGVVATLFVRPIRALIEALRAAEGGDLTKGVKVTAYDEIGSLERHFNSMLQKLNQIMCRVEESGKSMSQSAFQIASISHEIAEVGKSEQSRSREVTDVTNQLREIAANVQQLADGATERASQTAVEASSGIELVKQNIDAMRRTADDVDQAETEIGNLQQTAEQISTITGTIGTIAEQTNLLALNAAIEAARAGEQGRGFAVVADEVRTLAANTTRSANEIAEIIETLIKRVHQVTATMDTVVEQVTAAQSTAQQSADKIELVSNDVQLITSANQDISGVSSEQIERLTTLEGTLERLFETIGDSSSKVETTATIGGSLYEVAEKLNILMQGFNFSRDGKIEMVQDEKRKHPRLMEHLLVHVRQQGRSYEGLSADISKNGMKLLLGSELHSDAPIEFEIRLPYDDVQQYENQIPLKVGGTLRWSGHEGDYHAYGIEFESLNSSQQCKVEQCFDYFNTAVEHGVAG